MKTPSAFIDLDKLPPVLKPEEVAQILRVNKKSIYKGVDDGEIKAARIGPRRMIRIKRETVLAMLAGA